MLKDLITTIFVDENEKILLLLRKVELDNFISDFFNRLNELQTSDFEQKKNIAGTLASTYLTRLNSVLEKIDNIEEKKELEYILSDISSEFIHLLLQKKGISQENLLTQIRDSLITTCIVNNWNTELLLKKIRIDLLHILSVNDSSIDNDLRSYYSWLGSIERLNELAYNLKDRKTIKSTGEFKKLFSSHTGNIRVRIDSEQINFIIVLFDQLKVKRLIKPCGTKGHFYPLKSYCVDFDKNVLIKNDPKRKKELIRRNNIKYRELVEEVDLLIGMN
jgi:predicted nucleic acid-binding protein